MFCKNPSYFCDLSTWANLALLPWTFASFLLFASDSCSGLPAGTLASGLVSVHTEHRAPHPPQRQLQHLPVTTPVSAKPPTSFMSSSSWVPSSYWSFPVARRTSGAADVPLVALPVGLLISRFSIHTFSSGSSSILLSILLRHASVCSILPLARRQVLPRNQCILACAIFFQDPVGDPDTVTKFHLSTHSKFKNPRPTSTFS